MTALLISSRDPPVVVIGRHVKVFLLCCQWFCLLYNSDDTNLFGSEPVTVPLYSILDQIKDMEPYSGIERVPMSIASRL